MRMRIDSLVSEVLADKEIAADLSEQLLMVYDLRRQNRRNEMFSYLNRMQKEQVLRLVDG